MPLLVLTLATLAPHLQPANDRDEYRRWRHLVDAQPKVLVHFRRIEYDDVFEVEKHAHGRLVWNGPEDWRIEVERVEFETGQRGNRYELAPVDSETWIRNGDVMVQSSGGERNVFRIPHNVPADPCACKNATWFGGGWLACLGQYGVALPLGLLPTDAVDHALVRAGDESSPPRVSIVPADDWREQTSRVDLLLGEDGQPMATKVYHATGNGSAVYVFERWEGSAERFPNPLPEDVAP